MTYLNPWAIGLAAAAAVLPVVIHLLTKPRPKRLPISTLRFIRGAISQRRSRSRLRDLIILTLRTLAILLLGWTIARPMLGQRPVVDPSKPGDAIRVVVLDASASLAARQRGIETFQKLCLRYNIVQSTRDLALAGEAVARADEPVSGVE